MPKEIPNDDWDGGYKFLDQTYDRDNPYVEAQRDQMIRLCVRLSTAGVLGYDEESVVRKGKSLPKKVNGKRVRAVSGIELDDSESVAADEADFDGGVEAETADDETGDEFTQEGLTTFDPQDFKEDIMDSFGGIDSNAFESPSLLDDF